jgi:serine/threonine protein phosphatase PrpC
MITTLMTLNKQNRETGRRIGRGMLQLGIRRHEDARQGYTASKPSIYFNGRSHPYTEDTSTTFEMVYPRGEHIESVRTLTVSSVCDGHAGYLASYTVTMRIPELFPTCLDDAKGDVSVALGILFTRLVDSTARMTSGTTCNVTVFDPAREKVHIASLGDSPMIRYRKGLYGKYRLVWKSEDQDCTDPVEIDRMVKIHKSNGDHAAVANTVVYQEMHGGHPTGVWRNRQTLCMLHSSFGDLNNNYYPKMVNTVPRIYTQDWLTTQRSDVWCQCTDGLLEWLTHSRIGIQPRSDVRVSEIAAHLDKCHRDENVAHSLHEMQIDSMLQARLASHPSRTDSTREWVESTFDNHITKIFMWG